MDINYELKKAHKECGICSRSVCRSCDNREKIYNIIHSRPFGVAIKSSGIVTPKDMDAFLCKYRHRVKKADRDRFVVRRVYSVRGTRSEPQEIPANVRYNMTHPFLGGAVSPR